MAGNFEKQQPPRRGTNFIVKHIDPIDSALTWSLFGGLAAAGIVLIIVIGLSYYKYHLDTKATSLETQMETAANKIRADKDFEKKFLTTQAKLDLYATMNDSEKMIDLFPVLRSLIPAGVQVLDLKITPDTVEITCLAVNEDAIAQLSSNILAANGRTFGNKGEVLRLGNPDVQAIALSNNYAAFGIAGYEETLAFNYSIEQG